MAVRLQPPTRMSKTVAPKQEVEQPVSMPVMQPQIPVDPSQLQFNNSPQLQLDNPAYIPQPVPPIPPHPVGYGPESVDHYVQHTLQQMHQVMDQPPVVVRRNLTVAEIIVLFLAACLTVGGIQAILPFIPKPSVNIEWRR